jgi:hypothetical protein
MGAVVVLDAGAGTRVVRPYHFEHGALPHDIVLAINGTPAPVDQLTAARPKPAAPGGAGVSQQEMEINADVRLPS